MSPLTSIEDFGWAKPSHALLSGSLTVAQPLRRSYANHYSLSTKT
jgi:hypothetical protein